MSLFSEIIVDNFAGGGGASTGIRFFLIARSDGQPIVWPEQTYGDPDSLAVRAGIMKHWKTAATRANLPELCGIRAEMGA